MKRAAGEGSRSNIHCEMDKKLGYRGIIFLFARAVMKLMLKLVKLWKCCWGLVVADKTIRALLWSS
jgi:hypothetical protein